MANLNQLKNPTPNPGDSLRDTASDYLEARYGKVRTEKRECGKKVDAYFEVESLGKKTRHYLEAKDYGGNLTRAQVRDIWADYMGILEKNRPSKLLLVTRNGLSPDAEAYVQDEITDYLHLTIWEVENQVLDLSGYQIQLRNEYSEDGIQNYYIPAKARIAEYSSGSRREGDKSLDLFDYIESWVVGESSQPIAILGGYGAGKTTFAKHISNHYANLALMNPTGRRVISIKLGDLTSAASLQYLLGGMFTSTYPIQNFNFSRFQKFNADGRLLIILDGFDEMKHAMPWNDFKFIISELNKLVVPNSKIILLGRPTALLSENEHWHVLRGLKKLEDNVMKLPGWPEFLELDLEQFTGKDRKLFTRKYIEHSLNTSGNEMLKAEIDKRVEQVEAIASEEPEIFSKPVHLRILVEIAAYTERKLHDLKQDFSRWKLYRIFVDNLIERETEKQARLALTKAERLDFLRELIIWLWNNRGGNTHFSIGELPFKNLTEADLRERLIGSLLEKKTADYYYFAHRSFPEYFLADLMLTDTCEPNKHERNSGILTDGVELFVQDGAKAEFYIQALSTLSEAHGNLSLRYLNFLLANAKQKKVSINMIDAASTWKPLADIVTSSHVGEPDYVKSIDTLISSGSTPEQIAMTFLCLFHIKPKFSILSTSLPRKLFSKLIAELLIHLFKSMTSGDVERRFVIGTDSVPLLNILRKGVRIKSDAQSGRYFAVDVKKVDKAITSLLLNSGVSIDFGNDDYFDSHMSEYNIAIDIVANFSGDFKRVVLAHISNNRGFGGITEAVHRKKKPTIR